MKRSLGFGLALALIGVSSPVLSQSYEKWRGRLTQGANGGDCASCNPVPLHLRISKEILTDKVIGMICSSYTTVDEHVEMRSEGIQIFGNIENYYNTFDQFVCDDDRISPTILHRYINYFPGSFQHDLIGQDLEKINPHIRIRILNRYHNGRSKLTLVDLFDKKINILKDGDTGQSDSGRLRIYNMERQRDLYIRLGGKRYNELSQEEKRAYAYNIQ